MTLEKLESIVLRLANQTHVRYYKWLNYPNEPQIMGIQLQEEPGKILKQEFYQLGLRYQIRFNVWTVERESLNTNRPVEKRKDQDKQATALDPD